MRPARSLEKEPADVPAQPTLPDYSNRVTITQGVWGEVLFFEEDLAEAEAEGTIDPVSRMLHVHEPARMGQVTWSQGLGGRVITAVNTPLVDSTRSGEDGFFEIALPVGRYSLFLKEGGLYFPNHISAGGELSTFDVFKERTTHFRFYTYYETGK